MFTLFKKKYPESRFNCTALKQLLPLLDDLREKAVELKAAAESKGAGSIDFKKHIPVDHLLHQIETIVTNFNNAKPLTNDETELHEVLLVVQHLKAIVAKVVNEHGHTLMEPRNSNRENADSVLHYGTLSGGLFTVISGSFSMIGGIATLFAANIASGILRESIGLTKNMPKSAQIVAEWGKTLLAIEQNLVCFLEKKSEPLPILTNNK